MQRVEEEELLDSDQWSPEEVSCALTAIRRVNYLYGGDKMHKVLFRRVAAQMPAKSMKVLEVASGRAEVLQAASMMLLKQGFTLDITLLDRSALHLPQHRDWNPAVPMPTLITGDALELPLADGSMDVVACCLFLHHLGPRQAALFLQEALRVARVAVLINDVERSRMNYLLSHFYTLVDPSKLSRHDGPTSVRQAYTFCEMQDLLRATGARYDLRRGYLFRLGATLWKNG